MSKRAKGLSFDEKRSRMMSIFHEKKDFFTLKELEKMGPKEKGVVVQSVKEVLDSLLADNMLTCEKIGTSNYYWAFPSTALVTREKKLAQLMSARETLEAQLTETERLIAKASEGREESNSRVELLALLQKAEAEKKMRVQELQKYKDNDPVMLSAKEKSAKIARNAANRWTDNVFSLQSYCANNFNIDGETFKQQFGLGVDFDSV